MMIVLFVLVGMVQERYLLDYDDNGKYKLAGKTKKKEPAKDKKISDNV